MSKVTIIGLGLIGGSLGLALRVKPTVFEISGYSRRPETAREAMKMGAIDRYSDSLENAVKQAELVIVATPVLAVKDIFQNLAKYLPHGCTVTDTASTKVKVMEWAEQYLPPSVSFIGGHPMAGKETSGIEAADASLFKGCTYCLTKSAGTSDGSLKLLEDIINKIGARSFVIDAGDHDRLVAGISHLPFLVSIALAHAATTSKDWETMSKLASSGYRDMTRLASGNVEMMKSIILTNQDNIKPWIERLIDELQNLKILVTGDNRQLTDLLQQVKEARRKWYAEKYRGQ